MVTITLSENQLKLLCRVTEEVSRLYMGQMDILQTVSKSHINYETLNLIKKLLFNEFNSIGQYYGITSNEISDDARQLYDMYQVMRYVLAWKDADNTPETRDYTKQIQVWYDTPMRTSENEELIQIKMEM